MTSRVWPAPTPAEARAAATNELEDGNDVDIEEDEDDDEDSCEGHSFCEVCEECIDCGDCTCTSVYVVYATRVCVEVNWEGDVVSVVGDSNLEGPYDVIFEDESRVPDGPLRDRALNNVRERDWPSCWDWS